MEDLANELQSKLLGSGYSELRQVNCIASEDGLIIRGIVSSYFLRQIAQSLILAYVSGEEILWDISVIKEKSSRIALVE